jgi:uncharacterized membrane protein
MTDTFRWLGPALGFVLLSGVLGVTTKLALQHADWMAILVWTAVVYAGLAGAAVLFGGGSLYLGEGWGWAALCGVCASVALVCSFVALRHADAVVVVPVMAAYPVVTVAASLAFLGESVSPSRLAGIVLVVVGAVIIAR